MDTQVPSIEGNCISSPVENNKTDYLQHKTHCDKCFDIKKCLRLKSSAKVPPKEIISSCPIIFCRFSCSRQFHQCKRDEHELLCPNVKVPCINKEYGCPVILERRLKSKHLSRCPASVVVCTMEWNRWPLPPGKIQPFAMDPSQLDVSATLRDQRIISEWKQKIPSSLRNTLRCYPNEGHPVMPLGVSGLRIPNCIAFQAKLESESSDFSESIESDHDESSDSPWGAKKSPPGLQESVCNKLKTIKINREPEEPIPHTEEAIKDNSVTNGEYQQDDEFHSCSSSIVDGEDAGGELLLENDSSHHRDVDEYQKVQQHHQQQSTKSKEINLNIVLEVVTRYQIKPDSMYTFMCAREFRRDEYANHFANIHCGIHTQLNGWLFTRCPLASQGCAYGTERMCPNDSNYRIVFNEALDVFCFTQKLTAGDTMQNYISSLPFELLIHLTKYLDPLSLNSLSMTNTLFREVCECVIVERGIVVLQWEKHPTQKKWEVINKKWLFSTSFSPVKKWSFADIGSVSNHMKECSHFQRNIQTAPFRYPVEMSQL